MSSMVEDELDRTALPSRRKDDALAPVSLRSEVAFILKCFTSALLPQKPVRKELRFRRQG